MRVERINVINGSNMQNYPRPKQEKNKDKENQKSEKNNTLFKDMLDMKMGRYKG